MSKQTAVHWLMEQVADEENQKTLSGEQWKDIVEQAIQMEKEQNEYFFNCGRQYQLTGEGTFKQVHNETYGGNNE